MVPTGRKTDGKMFDSSPSAAQGGAKRNSSKKGAEESLDLSCLFGEAHFGDDVDDVDEFDDVDADADDGDGNHDVDADTVRLILFKSLLMSS